MSSAGSRCGWPAAREHGDEQHRARHEEDELEVVLHLVLLGSSLRLDGATLSRHAGGRGAGGFWRGRAAALLVLRLGMGGGALFFFSSSIISGEATKAEE
jgi:hypothetical protein